MSGCRLYGAVLAVLLSFRLFRFFYQHRSRCTPTVGSDTGVLAAFRQLRIIRRLACLPGTRAGRIDNLPK